MGINIGNNSVWYYKNYYDEGLYVVYNVVCC